MKRYLPLALFLALAVLLGVGLTLKPREIPSVLIGKSAPPFTLPQLDPGLPAVSPAQFAGQPWVLNVWASWCSGCVVEHPVIVAWKDKLGVPLIGLNYKDKNDEALRWLDVRGNPYTAIAVDAAGRTGIDYGVYGVPETFVIGADGRIVAKHIGPLTDDAMRDVILPAIKEGR
ncbi:DsbE family thiol:disulfide interchange protein [Chitinibacteraceae bacterium HSL-7]